ncbi:hydroxymethylbilane synthase, partial [bacterium LRH843]|nr:hydroxymethylbilane synthase [bacterium LRH843]
DRFIMAAVLERDEAHDAFIAADGKSTFDDLPAGSIIGTSSPRRKAFVLAQRPDLKVVSMRGNVDTRLQKLKDGVVDATFLALAGL